MKSSDIKSRIVDKYGDDVSRYDIVDGNNIRLSMKDGNILTISKGSLDDVPDLSTDTDNKSDKKEDDKDKADDE